MDNRSRNRYKEFQTLLSDLKTSGVKFNETKGNKKQRLTRVLTDYTAFVNYYFADGKTIRRGTTSWFQKKAVEEILNSPFYLGVHQWARGFAKSTTFSEFLPIFLMIQGKANFTVIISADKDSAIKKISNIRSILQTNRKLIQDFGPFFKVPSVGRGFFTTQQGKSFIGLGKEQSPRGLNVQGQRPDLLILDDIDDDEIVLSKSRVNTLYKKVCAAAYMTRGQGDMRFIIVGNKISYNSIVHKFEQNEKFTVSKINALNEQGESNWPQVYSTERIKQDIEVIGSIAASTEMFNTPIVEGNIFKPEWLTYDDITDFEHVIVYYDPTWKATDASDHKSVITLGYNKECAKYVIFDVLCRVCDMSTLVLYFREIEKLVKPYVHEYYQEANFNQDLLIKAFHEHSAALGLAPLPIKPDKSKKKQKKDRVKLLAGYFQTNHILIHERVRNTEDYKTFESQLLSFGKSANIPDDGPDALEGAFTLLSKKISRGTKLSITLGNKRPNFFKYLQ